MSYSRYFSTGVGGAGNIRKLNIKEIAHEVPSGPYYVPRSVAAGRGGYGNISEARRLEKLRLKNSTQDPRSSIDSQASMSSETPSG